MSDFTNSSLWAREEVERLKQMARDNGVEVDNLPDDFLEKREAAFRENQDKEFMRLRQRVYFKHSLWGGASFGKFTFDDWLPEKQKEVQKAKKIKQQGLAIAKALETKSFNVFFAGGAGTGKTVLSLAIANHLKGSKTFMFISTPELYRLVVDYNESEDTRLRNKIKRKNIERAMYECDVLLLDDFGSETGMISGFKEAANAYQIYLLGMINKRNDSKDNQGDRNKATIVTSNNSFMELQKMFNSKLLDRLITKNPDNSIIFSGLESLREV